MVFAYQVETLAMKTTSGRFRCMQHGVFVLINIFKLTDYYSIWQSSLKSIKIAICLLQY